MYSHVSNTDQHNTGQFMESYCLCFSVLVDSVALKVLLFRGPLYICVFPFLFLACGTGAALGTSAVKMKHEGPIFIPVYIFLMEHVGRKIEAY